MTLVGSINNFELNNYKVYVSREEKKILASYESKNIDIFKGRMNNYLNEIKISENNLFFLCGNSRMVSEVYDVLVSKEVSQKNIFTEIFF